MSAISVPWSRSAFPRTVPAAVPRLSSLAFGALIGAIAVLGMMLVLFINVLTTQGAFTEARLKGDVRAIEAAQQRAQQTLAMLASPGNLESRARAMGMVPAASPVFLRLSDAKVFGQPEPATYQEAPAAIGRLMPTQALLSPDLATAPAARKAHIIPPTSDAAVELPPESTS